MDTLLMLLLRWKKLIIKSMLDSGAIGLSLDSIMNLEELKKIIPKEIALNCINR